MKIVNLDEQMKMDGAEKGCRLLTEEQGCVKGCCSGVTIYEETEYGVGGIHDDQEGFLVLKGHGMVKLGEEEFPIRKGSSFLAPAGCFHAVKRDADSEAIWLFWFHSAV